MGHGLTEEELKGLSEAEREAITAEPSESEAALAKGAPGVVDETPPADGVDPLKAGAKTEIEGATDKDEDDEATKTAAAAAAKVAAEAAAAVATPASPAVEVIASHFRAPPVDRVKAEADLKALTEQFDNQDLTLPEYLEKRDAIKQAILLDDLSQNHSAQTELDLWKADVRGFIGAHEAYKDPVLYDSLNAQVKKIAADDANVNLSNRQVLEKAHAELAARFKLDPAKPEDPAAKAAAAVAAKKAEQEAKGRTALAGVPPTLAGVPAAAPQNADTDEFAHIDAALASGDSMRAEQAIAKLSAADQARYAAS